MTLRHSISTRPEPKVATGVAPIPVIDSTDRRARGGQYPLLSPPAYGPTRDGATPHPPTVREVLHDWFDAVDLRRGQSRIVPFCTAIFYVATGAAAVRFVARGPRIESLVLVALGVFAVSTLYNTVWLHRYCSHQAFRFATPLANRFFLWSNPIFFREETYALPHHVHHAQPDQPGDPYGPHLGWLGSFLAFEPMQRTHTLVPRWRYRALVKLLAHVGIPINSYEAFQRTAAVEPIGHFLLRATVAQIGYAMIAYLVGGVELVLGWFTVSFALNTLLRDFNWRGHGGRRAREPAPNRPGPSHARDQRFYGLLAGEWHGGHHRAPRSARSGLLPGQPDPAFALIALLHRVGVVADYHDALATQAPRAP